LSFVKLLLGKNKVEEKENSCEAPDIVKLGPLFCKLSAGLKKLADGAISRFLGTYWDKSLAEWWGRGKSLIVIVEF
jgi:hypothetical protein